MTKESLKNEINKLNIGKQAIGNVTSDQFTAKSLLNLNLIWIAVDIFQFLLIFIREGVKKTVFIWDFVPNNGPHPPTARVWDSTK